MRPVIVLAVVTFCIGWTVWWGRLAAKRRRWGLAIILWLLAAGLAGEVAWGFYAAARHAALPED